MPTESLHQIEDAWALVDELGAISARLAVAIEKARELAEQQRREVGEGDRATKRAGRAD